MTRFSIFLTLFFGLVSQALWSQGVPERFNYQGLARDADGVILSDMPIGLRLTLFDAGTQVFQETHSIQTNAFGIFTLEVGSVSSGLGSLNWSSGNLVMQVELDAGAGFQNMGQNDLLSVPYALQALQASSLASNAPLNPASLLPNGALPNQVLKWNGSTWAPGPDLQGGAPSGPAGGDLGLNYPNPRVQGLWNRPLSSSMPQNGEVLKWVSSTNQWTPQPDLQGGLTLPFAGASSANGSIFKVDASSISGRGVEGFHTNSTYSGSLGTFLYSGRFIGPVYIDGNIPAGNVMQPALRIESDAGPEILMVSNSWQGSSLSFKNTNPNGRTWTWNNMGINGNMALFLTDNNFTNEEVISFARVDGVNFSWLRPGLDNHYLLGNGGFRWRSVWSALGTIQTSDQNCKRNIEPLNYGMAALRQLKPVSYQWISEEDDKTYLGFLAQEVEAVVPEAIYRSTDSDRLGMNYAELIPVLVKAIQELEARVEELESRLE